MKKLALIIGLLATFLAKTPSVEAACVPASGLILSCKAPNSVRCPISTTGGGGTGGTLLCCETPDECTAKKTEIKNNQFQQVVIKPKIEDLCKSAGDKSGDCEACFLQGKAYTAIGCIETTPSGFIGKFLSLGIGIAGGIAFLLILFGGFQMTTSAGNPEKLNAGKELVTAAISGLVLIVFSIFLLRLVGVNILGLPEFQ